MADTYQIGPEFDDYIIVIRVALRDGRPLSLKERMFVGKILDEHQERLKAARITPYREGGDIRFIICAVLLVAGSVMLLVGEIVGLFIDASWPRYVAMIGAIFWAVFGIALAHQPGET